MRLRVFLIALAAAAVAGAVSAQSTTAFRLRGKFTRPALIATPTPDNSAPADVRGSGGPAAVSPAPTDDDGEPLRAPLPVQGTSQPAQSFAGGLPAAPVGGFAASALPSLPALRPVGDQAPICRTECSKTRLYCAGTDDPGCDSQWAQCIAACSATTTP